jgi:hypothetical protein
VLTWKGITSLTINSAFITIKEANSERTRLHLNLLEKSHIIHATDTEIAQEIYKELVLRWEHAQRNPGSSTLSSPTNSPRFLRQLFTKDNKDNADNNGTVTGSKSFFTKLKRSSTP